MDDELPDFTALQDPGDISNDGTLGIDDSANVQSTDLPDYSPLSPNDIAPLDNVNGTSTAGVAGDPTNVINSMFSTDSTFGNALDLLTGGATGLAAELSGDFLPVPANQTAAPDYTPLILLGVGIVVLFVVLK